MDYTRQIQLFGADNQELLSKASVLVVGIGGLGCPVLQLLSSMGVGKLGMVDFDRVEAHNLHRQFLFDKASVGLLKTEAAVARLKARNDSIQYFTYPYTLTNANVFATISPYDIVVDCTDNFAVRYLLSDACAIAKKPLVYGALYQYEGQVSVFNVPKNGYTTTYRDVFPTAPQPEEIPTCNQAGVLPTISSFIAHLQANEVIKLLTHFDEVLIHTLLIVNTKNYQLTKIQYMATEQKNVPKTVEEVQNCDYPSFCHQGIDEDIDTVSGLERFLADENAILVDVREADEQPKIKKYKVLEIPLSTLPDEWEQLKDYPKICFVCVAGVRSKKALKFMQHFFPEKELKSFTKGFSPLV